MLALNLDWEFYLDLEWSYADRTSDAVCKNQGKILYYISGINYITKKFINVKSTLSDNLINSIGVKRINNTKSIKVMKSNAFNHIRVKQLL